jgi:hypothetical protein
MAATTAGLTVRRGLGVCGLVSDTGSDGTVRVTGVRTDGGEEIAADLVVDSGGTPVGDAVVVA